METWWKTAANAVLMVMVETDRRMMCLEDYSALLWYAIQGRLSTTVETVNISHLDSGSLLLPLF
jgi:hypothetical protein